MPVLTLQQFNIIYADQLPVLGLLMDELRPNFRQLNAYIEAYSRLKTRTRGELNALREAFEGVVAARFVGRDITPTAISDHLLLVNHLYAMDILTPDVLGRVQARQLDWLEIFKAVHGGHLLTNNYRAAAMGDERVYEMHHETVKAFLVELIEQNDPDVIQRVAMVMNRLALQEEVLHKVTEDRQEPVVGESIDASAIALGAFDLITVNPYLLSDDFIQRYWSEVTPSLVSTAHLKVVLDYKNLQVPGNVLAIYLDSIPKDVRYIEFAQRDQVCEGGSSFFNLTYVHRYQPVIRQAALQPALFGHPADDPAAVDQLLVPVVAAL